MTKTARITVAAVFTLITAAAAVAQTPQWTLRATTGPSARSSSAMVYDNSRGVVMLFGGSAGPTNFGDTWKWSGSAWSPLSPGTSPSARNQHAMAFDTARGVAVLFGGNMTNDTYEWNGTTWSLKNPANRPSGRSGHAMAYDAARSRSILFGGNTGSGYSNQTWTWDGTNWTQLFPANSPSARNGHAMAYDSLRQVVVLFGGYTGSTNLGDTWEWSGSNWTQRNSVNNPAARYSHGMAFDPARNVTVMFGGELGSSSSNNPAGDTWEWNGTVWTQRSPTTSPPARESPIMAYDAARGKPLLFGGTQGGSNYVGDTWDFGFVGTSSFAAGNYFTANGNTVYEFAPSGSQVRTATIPGLPGGTQVFVWGFTPDPRLIVSTDKPGGSENVFELDASLTVAKTYSISGGPSNSWVTNAVVGPDNRMYAVYFSSFSSSGPNTVYVLDRTTGVAVTSFQTTGQEGACLDFLSDGYLYIDGWGSRDFARYQSTSPYTRVAGPWPLGGPTPAGGKVRSGPNNHLFITRYSSPSPTVAEYDVTSLPSSPSLVRSYSGFQAFNFDFNPTNELVIATAASPTYQFLRYSTTNGQLLGSVNLSPNIQPNGIAVFRGPSGCSSPGLSIASVTGCPSASVNPSQSLSGTVNGNWWNSTPNPNAVLRVVYGFRNSAGNWIGPEPKVLGSPAVPPTCTPGVPFGTRTWSIVTPSSTGSFNLWMYVAQAIDDASAIADFKAHTTATPTDREKTLCAVTTTSGLIPAITNLTASQVQGTQSVRVQYNLQSPNGLSCQMTMAVSSNGGASYDLIPLTLTPANGSSVAPGSALQIIWSAGQDWPNHISSQMRVRLTATHPTGGTASSQSPTFALDTTTSQVGTVYGRALDELNHALANAYVLIPLAFQSGTTDVNGYFSLQVPAGSGYEVQVGYQCYGTQVVPNVSVLPGQVTNLGDIHLQSVAGTSYVIRPLAPNINPTSSEIEDGSVAYRYYLVRRQSDNSLAEGGVCVAVRRQPDDLEVDQSGDIRPGWAGRVAGVTDAGSGIVRVRIPAAAVGPAGQTKQFQLQVGSVSGPVFSVSVVPKLYSFTWSQESAGGLRGRVNLFGGIQVGGQRGHKFTVSREFGNGETTEDIERELTGRAQAGLQAALPIGGRARFLGGQVGVYGSGEVGLYAELHRAFTYEFDRNSTDPQLALLRLFCAYRELEDLIPVFGPVLSFAGTIVEPIVVDGVYREARQGWELGGYMGGEGIFGGELNNSVAQLGVGLKANLSFEGGLRCEGNYIRNENRLESSAGFAGSFQASSSLGIGLRPYAGTGRPAAFQTVMENLGAYGTVEGELSVEQSIVTSKVGTSTFPDHLSLDSELGVGPISVWPEIQNALGGAPAIFDETHAKAAIELSQPVVSASEWQNNNLVFVASLFAAQAAPVMTSTFGSEITQTILRDNAFQRDISVNITADVVRRDTFGLDGDLTFIAGGGFSLSLDFEKGRHVNLMKGAIRGSLWYPFEITSGLVGVPANTASILDLQGAWFGQALQIISQLLNRSSTQIGGLLLSDTTIQKTTTAGAASLVIPTDALPIGSTVVADAWDVPPEQRPQDVNLFYGLGGVYRFSADQPLAGPVTLVLSYQDAEVVGFAESEIAVYQLDDTTNRWQLIPGVLDTNANTVTCTLGQLGTFALSPRMPSGDIEFNLSASVVPADGTSTVVAASVALPMNDRSAANNGWQYTVTTSGMELITPDVNPDLPGTQVGSTAAQIQLTFRAPNAGGVGAFAVASAFGDSRGAGTVAFEDSTPPPAVVGLTAAAGQSRLSLSWDDSNMPSDLASYRVYYRADQAGPPWDGVAAIEGADSPITIPPTPSCVLKGLSLGNTYYASIIALDASGNEGPPSAAVSATLVERPPAPPTGVMSDHDGDEAFVVAWTLSEDDGLNDRDVDHYEVYRRTMPGGSIVRVVDVPAGQSVFTDTVGPGAGMLNLQYSLVAVDTSGLRSAPTGPIVAGDLNLDNVVDGSDFAIFLHAFGSCSGAALFDALADFDDDGCVTFVDYQMWLQFYRNGQGNPLAPPPIPSDVGDMNADGRIDGQDIQGFVNAMLSPGTTGFRSHIVADLDGDGVINDADVQAFSARLLGAAE